MQKISSNAFKSCSKITTLTLPNMLTEIGDNAFEGTGITSITIPSNCYSIGQGVFTNCESLSYISVASANQYYKSDYGILFDYNKDTLFCYPPAKYGSTYTIPASIKCIKAGAFSSSQLTKLNIQTTSLDSIYENTFVYSKLTSINIPEGVKYIGDNAFSSSMKKITLPSTLTKINGVLFYEDNTNKLVLDTII